MYTGNMQIHTLLIRMGLTECLSRSLENSFVRFRGNEVEDLGSTRSSRHLREITMVTCYLKYVIDPYKVAEFEKYAKMWIPLVNRMGGNHHGYFLPHEGANNIAVALFSFPSLSAYEKYREEMSTDLECQEAFKYAEHTRCVVSYERSFMKPIFE